MATTPSIQIADGGKIPWQVSATCPREIRARQRRGFTPTELATQARGISLTFPRKAFDAATAGSQLFDLSLNEKIPWKVALHIDYILADFQPSTSSPVR